MTAKKVLLLGRLVPCSLSAGLSNKILQLLTPAKARTGHGKQKEIFKKCHYFICV